MNRQSQRTLATTAAFGLLLSLLAAAQTPPPAAPAQAPAPATPRKLISPVRGDATVEITKPNTQVKGNDVITTFMLKNTSTAPIAGLRIEENWYDRSRNPIGGDIYRHTRPLMVNEVITVTLTTPRKQGMGDNQYNFSHANGAVKASVVPKLVPTPPTS
jgi:hypothetical protein